MVAGLERGSPPVIDGHSVRRGKFVPVERGVSLGNNRPRVRVGGCLAGKVPGVEFLEGSVDVVGVKHDLCRDPIVGVDFGDDELSATNSPYRASLFG